MKNKYLVIDSHIHYASPEAAAKSGVSGTFDYSALLNGEMSIPYRRTHDIEGILRVMEDGGVDMAVLGNASWAAQGLEVCKALNNAYAKLRRDYPGKFILCGHFPPEPGKDVIYEIERCVKELGLLGLTLVSSTEDMTLDSPELWPIYKKINEMDVPIVIHPSVRFPIWGGGKKYELRRTISREYDIAKAMVEVLYGVLKDFPNLKFLFPHYGGGMPGLKARLRAWFEPEGWKIPANIKDCPKTPRELDELGLAKAFDELFDKLYFDIAGSGAGWLPMIKAGLLIIRADRTCFGTDYPYDMHDGKDIKAFVDVIKGMDIPEMDKKLILGENILRLFRIKK